MARRCFGTKWFNDVPGAQRTRDGGAGKGFANFFVKTYLTVQCNTWQSHSPGGVLAIFDKFLLKNDAPPGGKTF